MRHGRVLLLVLSILAASPRPVSAQTLPFQPGREPIPNADVLMTMVQSNTGYPLRLFVTRPHGATGKLPAVFLVGWLSCDSVEQPKGPEDGFVQLIWDIASRSGFATVRMDKPGVGDSGGPKCSDADFNEELEAYRSAFAALSRIDFVDTTKLYILGESNGGGFAPLVVGAVPVRAYLVFSGWYQTWLEHMLEHERRRMKLSGLSEPEINSRMKRYATFYDLYLNGKQSPGHIAAEHPEMKEIWYDKPESQYGRPAAYYQQLQALNLADAWSKISVPVLAVHGEYDWIMSEGDFRLLTAALNARQPGSAQFIEWPRLDHLLYAHSAPEKAFHRDPQQAYDPKLSDFVIDWLKKH
jgi:pimeloyl-ACP methyl ester carboxylesterase